MAISTKSAVDLMFKRPVITLAVAAAIVIGGLVAGGTALLGIRYAMQDRKVEKLEQKTDEAVTQKDAAKTRADQAAQERAIEDAIRERTIKPEIERTNRNLEEARSRADAARNDYEKARKQKPDLGDNPDPDALHQLNCAELRDLYPGESIPGCER